LSRVIDARKAAHSLDPRDEIALRPGRKAHPRNLGRSRETKIAGRRKNCALKTRVRRIPLHVSFDQRNFVADGSPPRESRRQPGFSAARDVAAASGGHVPPLDECSWLQGAARGMAPGVEP
jgi:hypothetical protein